VAATIPYFIEEYDSDEVVNISSGTTTSIRSLAQAVASAVGYQGAIEWDATKPDGQMVKIFDVKRLGSLGLSCKTSLPEGLSRTVKWFAANYETRGEELRL
jgi:GDP-L-fucose synthase